FCLGGNIFGLWILEEKDEALAIRRPFEIVYALRDIGEADALTAGAIEQPNLILAAIACGKESEVLAVRAPTRMRGGNAFERERKRIAAMGGNHPEALLVLVVLENFCPDGIGDPLAVGA